MLYYTEQSSMTSSNIKLSSRDGLCYAMTNGARASKTKSISTLNNFFSGGIDVFAEGIKNLPAL